MSEDVFYIVWNPDGPTNPRHHHRNDTGAKAEAERMAAQYPGQRFYVCQVLGYAQKIDVNYIELNDIPF